MRPLRPSVPAWIDPRYALAAGALALLSVALGVLAGLRETFPLDVAVMERVQQIGARYEPVALLFNEYNGVIVVAAGTVGALILLVRRRPDGVLLFALAAALRPSLNALKELVDRPRPSGEFPVLDVVHDSSFPSGHVMTAVVFFGLWFLLASELLPRRFVLPARVASAVVVGLFALSRVWAGVHWPSDTYGALLWASLLLAALMAVRPALARGCERAGAVLRTQRAE